jgi:hypothetical protein
MAGLSCFPGALIGCMPVIGIYWFSGNENQQQETNPEKSP